jgi:hypothetical protein
LRLRAAAEFLVWLLVILDRIVMRPPVRSFDNVS